MDRIINGKNTADMTKDEIITAIMAEIGADGADTLPTSIDGVKHGLEMAFSMGWKRGEKYATKTARINFERHEKQIRDYYGDKKCEKCGTWQSKDNAECDYCGGKL